MKDHSLLIPRITARIKWVIQIPRLYSIYKQQGLIHCFQNMLDHIFNPLFLLEEKQDQDQNLEDLLQHVVGWNCVDDEALPELNPLVTENDPFF